MLETLDTQLKPKANTSKLNMLMHLTNIKHNSKDLDAYFGHICMLTGELEANGLVLPETYLLMVTLDSLTTDYNPIHTIIKSTDDINLAKAQKIGHTREKQLHSTLKALDIEVADSSLSDCTVCKQGKQTCKPIQSSPAPQAAAPLKHIHSDICSPFPVPTKEG